MTAGAVVRCGCCDRLRPRARTAELGSTPGVHLCRWCALWAFVRSFRR